MISVLTKILPPDIVKHNLLPHIHKIPLRQCIIDYAKAPDIVQTHPHYPITHQNDLFAYYCEAGHEKTVIHLFNTYDDLDMDKALYHACLGGHERIIILLEQLGARDWNMALRGAAQGGHRHLVEKYHQANQNFGLVGACEGGFKEIAQEMLDKGANNLRWAFRAACRGGYNHIIDWLLEMNPRILNWGIRGAAQGGHLNLLKRLFEMGGDEYNYALYGATMGGSLPILEWLNTHHNIHLKWSFASYGAYKGGQIHIIQWLQDKGLLVVDRAFNGACSGGRLKLVKELLAEVGTFDILNGKSESYFSRYYDIMEFLYEERMLKID